MTYYRRSVGDFGDLRLKVGNVALYRQQFSVEDAASCRTANGIVRKRDELVAENWAWTQPSNRSRHAAAKITITARLRAIRLREILSRLRGCAWQRGHRLRSSEGFPSVDDVVKRRLFFQLNRDINQMPINHRDTGARSAGDAI